MLSREETPKATVMRKPMNGPTEVDANGTAHFKQDVNGTIIRFVNGSDYPYTFVNGTRTDLDA
jgi:hypothetical protein